MSLYAVLTKNDHGSMFAVRPTYEVSFYAKKSNDEDFWLGRRLWACCKWYFLAFTGIRRQRYASAPGKTIDKNN